MSNLPVALQLYTLRDDAGKDYVGTVRKVAEMGYAGVELAGHGGLSVQDLKSLLDDCGLRIAGSHIGIDGLEKNIAQLIDDNLSLGNKSLVIPYLSEDRRQGAEGYLKTAEKLNAIGETLQAHGMSLGYHNHAFEFEKQENGKHGLEILIENTDASLVGFELDTYWALVGGEDPVAFLQKYRGRFPLLHLKDRDRADGSFAELGTGDLPLDEIIAGAPQAGTKWLIVEQDSCKRPPLESVKISFDYLKEKGYA